jgi:hypothetical protein
LEYRHVAPRSRQILGIRSDFPPKRGGNAIALGY